MDSNKNAYRVRVNTSAGNVYLICVSYPLDSKPSIWGLDFYELSWPSGLPSHSIPSARQATFKEELRAAHKASCCRESSAEGEDIFITKKIRSVYGDDTTICISSVDESMETYDF
jgi:hypothetical protein